MRQVRRRPPPDDAIPADAAPPMIRSSLLLYALFSGDRRCAVTRHAGEKERCHRQPMPPRAQHAHYCFSRAPMEDDLISKRAGHFPSTATRQLRHRADDARPGRAQRAAFALSFCPCVKAGQGQHASREYERAHFSDAMFIPHFSCIDMPFASTTTSLIESDLKMSSSKSAGLKLESVTDAACRLYIIETVDFKYIASCLYRVSHAITMMERAERQIDR